MHLPAKHSTFPGEPVLELGQNALASILELTEYRRAVRCAQGSAWSPVFLFFFGTKCPGLDARTPEICSKLRVESVNSRTVPSPAIQTLAQGKGAWHTGLNCFGVAVWGKWSGRRHCPAGRPRPPDRCHRSPAPRSSAGSKWSLSCLSGTLIGRARADKLHSKPKGFEVAEGRFLNRDRLYLLTDVLDLIAASLSWPYFPLLFLHRDRTSVA